MMEVDPELQKDARWQLVERITASPAFQKSTRIRDLLCFMAERTLHGQPQDLTEHRIGSAVLGKAEDYSVVEDSSVRVHVRQLRLKLHEYFDGEGRGETITVDIPKGAYTTVFRPAERRTDSKVETAVVPHGVAFRSGFLPWGLAVFFLTTTLVVWIRNPAAPKQQPPWPLATLFDQSKHPVQLVVADINYGMMHLVDEQQITLEQYLSPAYRSGEMSANTHPTVRELRAMKYLSSSLLTSYADVVVASSLIRMSGSSRDLLNIRSARELRPRDLEEGNFIFVGSPSSNPWVSYFQEKLNFREHEGAVGESLKYFQNLHPRAGEQDSYQGLTFTGSAGQDYATISLLPIPNGHGSVLILQGLQQEGTEAAGLFLADEGNRRKLQQALGFSEATTGQPFYFEALICVQAFAGTPNATSIVATREIHP
jgi:hypothetical protein